MDEKHRQKPRESNYSLSKEEKNSKREDSLSANEADGPPEFGADGINET